MPKYLATSVLSLSTQFIHFVIIHIYVRVSVCVLRVPNVSLYMCICTYVCVYTKYLVHVRTYVTREWLYVLLYFL